MNRDFVEMLSALNAAGVEYLVVGAHAVAAHGEPRATGDLDVWVRPTTGNARRVLDALRQFGAPLFDLTLDDLSHADTVFQIGVPPARIDLLTSITGVDFDRAWQNKIALQLEDLSTFCIGKRDLIENKRLLGRPKDLADVDALDSRH